MIISWTRKKNDRFLTWIYWRYFIIIEVFCCLIYFHWNNYLLLINESLKLGCCCWKSKIGRKAPETKIKHWELFRKLKEKRIWFTVRANLKLPNNYNVDVVGTKKTHTHIQGDTHTHTLNQRHLGSILRAN